MDVRDQLSKAPLFSGLSKKLMHTLSATANDRSYAAGDTIVKEGEKSVGFYFIVDGSVNVEKGGKVVATLGPGKFFGEMALLDEQPRTASIRAATRSRCLVLYSWEFWSSVGNDPGALRALLKEMVARLRSSAPAPDD
jgi:CRP/FNR family transcriptional regulator, cyclic AMP receptor protein